MINIKKIYEDAIAAMNAHGSVSSGDLFSTAENTVNQNNSGVDTEDVLGKCNHDNEGGYMKDGCFHLPTSTKKIQNREILAGKKKKNHKNDYVKSMKVISYEK